MRIYWSLSYLPELASLPKSERMRVWRSCHRKSFRHWQTWLALAACVLCGIAGGPVGGLIFSGAGMIFLCVAFGGGIGGAVYGHVATKMTAPYIREALSLAKSESAVS
jgi:hypothetical protein